MEDRTMTPVNVKAFYRGLPDELDMRAKTAFVWENMGIEFDRRTHVKNQVFEAQQIARQRQRDLDTVEAIKEAWL